MEDDGKNVSLEFQPIISEIGNVFLGGPFSGQVDDIFLIDSNVNGDILRMYIRHGANVVAFNVSSSDRPETWTRLWNRRFFNDAQKTSYPMQSYPWLVTNTMLDDGSDAIVLRNEDGIGFYRFHPNEKPIQVLGLSRDTSFRDLYQSNEASQSVVIVARFYPDTQLIGVLSRQKIESKLEVQFYGASKDRLKTRKSHPLFPLKNKNKDMSVVAKISEAINLYTADVQRSGQDVIIVRTQNQLEMYRFDDKYELQQVAKVSLVDGPWTAELNERFFFVNLTGQPYLDVVQFNRHGLFVYQLMGKNQTSSRIKDYTFVHYHAGFADINGWMPEYDESMRLVDTDGDGRDDLLFTGQKGLTILTFDPDLLLWKTLLDPLSQLDTAHRFVTVVGAIQAVTQGTEKKHSILFTVDEEKRLFMGKLLAKKVSQTIKSSTNSELVPVTNKILINTRPVIKTPASQVKRTTPIITEKPILRWTEQWAEPLSIENVVDPVTGSVDFTLPIFEPSVSDLIPHRILLSYSSSSQLASFSNIVGSGWSLPLPDNYIYVDYRGSIFVEDAAFYLMVEGNVLQMKPVLNDAQVIADGVRVYQEYSQPKWTIEFHMKEQRWIIITETDTFIYGSTRNMKVVRWNLNWSLWRGPGNDVKSLKPVPVAWYLIERQVKDTGKSIIYQYDIDSVQYKSSSPISSWTAAIRLKQISVESVTTITFDYAIKQKEEYQTFDHPFDDSDGFVFPVRMRESHYLSGCRIVTEHYKQTLKFVYQIEKSQRFLTAIEQPMNLAVNESVFQFSYHKEDEPSQSTERLLKEIKLPRELKVYFRYHSIAANIEVPDPYSSVKHPVDENPAIHYSYDYAAMVFRQRQLPDKIQVKILGAEKLETLAELSPIPATTQTAGKIRSYNVESFVDFFVVFLETDEKANKKQMCFFHRSNKDGVRKWNKDPSCHWFHRDALIRSTEAGVILVDNKEVIQIFELSSDRSKWLQHRLKLPSHQPVIRLEMVGHLIVGYDDRQLFVCHPDASKRNWQMRIIEKIPDLFSGGSRIVKKFRLPSDTEKNLIETLKKDILQLSSNSVVVSSLHLMDGQQLLLQMHFFLLDSDYNVALRREFSVKTDNILQLKHDFHSDGTRFQLGYKRTKDDFFRLTVVDVSGDLWSDTQKNSPKPSKEEVLKQINELENFQKLFDTAFLVNWTAQRTVITAEGLQVGNGTLIRMTGGDWQLEKLKSKIKKSDSNIFKISLGTSFVLEESVFDSNKKDQEINEITQNLTLYAQDPMDSTKKIGQPLHRLEIRSPDKFVSRYPMYLAYGTRFNSTTVIHFSDDGKKLASIFTFPNEQLLSESSSYDRLTTLVDIEKKDTPEKMMMLTRSLHSINPNINAAKRIVVKWIKMMSNIHNNTTRSTGYQWINNAKGNLTVTIIPGNDRKLAGWIQQTWTTGGISSSDGWSRTALEMFAADGQLVQKQTDEKNSGDPSAKTPDDDSILWDRSKGRIISDFSPYSLSDQMVSYYGFESYENNNSSSPFRWRFPESNLVKDGFALTGANYLRLNSNQSLLQGTFTPADQDLTYVASCWIRPSNGIDSLLSTTETNLVTSHLKAIIGVKETGEEIVGLLGRIMRTVGDWAYFEVLINFDIVKRLYAEISQQQESQQNQKTPQFTITFNIDANQYDGHNTTNLDVDHVRFSPFLHDFKATVYDSDNTRPLSVIGSSGSISRTIYYRNREMAIVTDVAVDSQQQVEQVTTASYTGRLIPEPKGSITTRTQQPPCRVAFFPENGGLYETFDAYAWRNRWNDPSANSTEAWTVAPGRLWHNHQQSHQLVNVDPSTLFGAESSSAAVRCYYSLISSIASMTWKLAGGQVRLARKSDQTFSSILTFQIQPDAKKSHTTVTNLPNSGEFIMMTEGSRFFIWIDSVLLLDLPVASASAVYPWSSFAFDAQGNTFVEDCVFMGNPRTEIEYLNEWGEKMQTVQLESDKSVLVSQILYDELGREGITTKLTRVSVDNQVPLLTFYSDFISGPIDPANALSVWKTHRLEGMVDRLNPLDKGVAYFRTEYETNPLNEKRVEGQPGPDFTVNGPYAKKFWTSAASSGNKNKIAVIENHFPPSKGFRQKIAEMPNGTKKVAVLDGQENRVALYVYVLGYDHLLSTYEYDSKNRLIKILPPIYHERAGTFMKTKPLTSMTKTKLSPEEIHLQKTLGTFMTYNEDTGLLIRKTTPDTGNFEYYYNRDGQLRLQAHSISEESNEIDSVVFYEYDDNGRAVARTGFLEQMPMSREKFLKSLAEGSLANVNFYQLIDRTEAEERHYDPSVSTGERNATFVTYNFNDNVLVEEMRWDGKDRLIESKLVGSLDQANREIKKTYYSHSNRLRSIQYPWGANGETNNLAIKLEHRYNKLGQLISLSLADQPGDIVRFSYHGSGQLASEYYLPDSSQHGFNRTFHYNSPGYLEQISDRFLSEFLSYTDDGYGSSGSGDGIVMRTLFNATWPPNADWRWFQLTNHSKLLLESNSSAQLCFQALKRNGYLTKTGRPLKDYYHVTVVDGQYWMPLVCGGRNGQQLGKVLAQKRMPRVYGHRYAYGNHQELVKAKYFTEETEKVAVPFQPDTLARQTALNKQQSRDIWKQLDDAGFITSEQWKSDWLTAVANPGKPLMRRNDLNTRLSAVTNTQEDVTLYRNLIEKMILNEIGQKRNQLITLDDFQKLFLQWSGIDDGLPFANSDQFRRTAEKVHRVLREVKDNSAWLDSKLKQIFHRPSNNSKYLADFIRILDQHFTYALGEHPFDVASFDIDANGNHRKFYTGFHRYEFFYDNDKANRIRSIKVDEIGKLDDVDTSTDIKAMLHDARGNVIQALHKGIERIEYNDASMRTTAIHLTDGRTVNFAYDSHGERILKQMMTKDGHLIRETHYVRDTEGKVLFDRRTTYSSTSSSILPELKDAASVIVSTAYIYGPRGLLGFIRNGAFHSVWTDHSGSIRLVLRDGQVVAAYDYLPYGQLMRSYGSDPAAEIFYRYTGQEWDDETGLYNYHARLYDPDIGRFYQPDPREQYFSPYKYVGNSPVSLVDPDGEFGLLMGLLIGVFAVGGTYLGGAAANKNYNPGKWDWKSGKTWGGIVGGALSGAVIPIGAVAAVGAIGIPATVAIGSATAYASAAAANDNWDLTKWKWDEPGTYNALFQGVSTGVGIVGGGAVAHQFANTFGKIGKFAILGGTYSSAVGFAYGKAVSTNNGEFSPWKWDWTNPGTFNALLEGVDTGIGLPTDFTQMGRGIYKLAKNSPKQLAALLPMLKKFQLKQLKPLVKSLVKGPIGKAAAGALTAYLMTSMANENFDPSGWNNSFATYEAFLNGMFFGTSARNMLKTGSKKIRHLKIKAKAALKGKLPKLITKMRFAMGRTFDNIRAVKIQRWVKHNLFQLKNTKKLLLSIKGDGLQFSARTSSDTKLLVLPDAQQGASHRLEAMEDAKNRMKNRENEAFTDREVGSLGCRPGLRKRRLKRGTTLSKECPVTLPDTELQAQLNKDPVSVLKNSPISTRRLTDPNEMSKGFQNGGIFNFELYPENGQASYSLKAKPISLNEPNSVQGYWLNTNDKIHIDPLGETRFIFTQELQSCSMYIKYDYDFIGKDGKHEPKMTVFHHNRRTQFGIYLEEGHYRNDDLDKIIELDGALELFDKNGNVLRPKDGAIVPLENIYRKDPNGNFEEIKELNKKPIQDIIKENLRLKKVEDDLAAEYDTVIRYEDYLAFPGHHNNVMHTKGLPITFSTPILYRDITDGQWYFASKKISYPEFFSNDAKFLPKLWDDMYIQFAELKSEKNKGNLNSILDFRRLYELDTEKVDLYIRKLDTIPRSQEEAVSLGLKKFQNRQQFKNYVQSLKSASSSESKIQPARSRWSEQIGVRDVERAQNKRDRRSVLLLDTRNTTHLLQCQSAKEETYLNESTHEFNYSYPTTAPYLVSSASRPASWIDLMSSITVSRQIIATIVSLDSIFDFVTVSLLPDVPIESIRPNQSPQNHDVDLFPQLDVSQTDYRDVSIGNCYSYSTNALTCYGHHGQTMVFTQSPSVDTSPPPLQQDQDTFHDCRPIEWHGQPSVTCLGADETTFIHSPYNRNSVAEKLVVAVDSWLILAYAAPGIYREILKMACHVKNVWTGSVCKIPAVPINDEDTKLWKMQLDKLEDIVKVEHQSRRQQMAWAFPLIEELREQIHSLSRKTIAETMDDVRALKTMTERLSALIEDIEEMTQLICCPTEHDEEDDDSIIFYDCFEDDFSVEKETSTNGYIKNAESVSAQLHHLTRSMSAAHAQFNNPWIRPDGRRCIHIIQQQLTLHSKIQT